jgi:hypothetical protein
MAGMRYIRVLHNGDLKKETVQPSPHWMVHVREDGSVWGEVLMRGWGRTLPADFRLAEHERFFEIPEELTHHELATPPHHEEIIVSLVRSGGYFDCSFLMSQLPTDCRLRWALVDLIKKIQEVVQAGPMQDGPHPNP